MIAMTPERFAALEAIYEIIDPYEMQNEDSGVQAMLAEARDFTAGKTQ